MRITRQLSAWLLAGIIGWAATPACGQAPSTTAASDFTPLLERLDRERFNDIKEGHRLLSPPIIYSDSIYNPDKTRRVQFEVALAAQPWSEQRRVVKLTKHGYPVSYSIMFDGCLVALFKSGKFGCYRLPDLVPDEQLESRLNGGGWERCWLIEGKLVAQNNTGTYVYTTASRAWQPYEQLVPFGQRPKLYEDARYLAYSDCNGEFGGTVYFYNKQTGKTHWANATCANSIWQEAGQYQLLVSLGHMAGSAACATIADPEVLPLLSAKKENKANWQYSFRLPEKGINKIFDFYGLQLFGAFRWRSQTLYLMHWRSTTFLATIAGQRITIVDPLFADGLYTHNPVTTTYGPDLALTNLNFYDLGEGNEMAILLWQGRQLTKVEWGKQPNIR